MSCINKFIYVSAMSSKQMEMFRSYLDRSHMEHKQYQYDGVKWALENELRDNSPCSVRGGFIADEMGLGKTIMMIGLMYCNFVKRTLIVVPPILVEQWYLQIYRTTGHKALVYYGIKKKTIDLDAILKAPIVITTYGAIWKKTETGPEGKGLELSLLHKVAWSRIIFDEAHHLRNSGTSRYISARLLMAKSRWLVSGTPVQNKKRDFYSLCSILRMPSKYYSNPANLPDIARRFILKRTKKQVGICIADICKERTIVKWANEKEMRLAEELHACLPFSGVGAGAGGRGGLLSDALGNNMLQIIMRARQSCIYPKLMMGFLQKICYNDNGVDEAFESSSSSSSKLTAVVKTILARKDNGNGKLVFCHFREEIDEIARRLKAGGMVNVATFDGRSKQRGFIFKEKHDVLILQIQTGCEGLNLQDNYNEVYFVSPHWNPAIEDQAIARCHRIGQAKTVYVQRFEMAAFQGEDEDRTPINVEKYIGNVQKQKRELASKIIRD